MGSLANQEKPTTGRDAPLVELLFYDVKAQFWFRNDGPARTVKMGFPECGGGDIGEQWGKRTAFMSFATTVDGAPVRARRVLTHASSSESYDAYWVKEVPFQAGQTRRVQVDYRSPVGTSALPALGVAYDFTGGNWKDKVDESRLVIIMHLPEFKTMNTETDLKRNGHRLEFVRTHWKAEARVRMWYQVGGKGFLCPASSERELTEKDLAGRSARDLTLMRNEIYARYGRPFRNSQVRAYFTGQTWYKEAPQYNDSQVPESERHNAEFIARYQRTHRLDW